MLGQVVVHAAPVYGPPLGPHLPTFGQLTRSVPGVVQAWSVMEHVPAMLLQGTAELHAALVNEQVPMPEQSEELRHRTDASLAQVPISSGHAAVLAHDALGGLLQTPFFVHVASAIAWVAPLQTFPGAAPQLPPTLLQSAFLVQTVTPSLQ
jgi:hypothetical protein